MVLEDVQPERSVLARAKAERERSAVRVVKDGIMILSR